MGEGKIEDFGHKQSKDFGERAANFHPIFLGVPLPGVIHNMNGKEKR